uniref:Uncharacterized protein n=1 Tax=Tanacetum cinerariifolium TaxID=118510 RepID=A0A699GI80_TANCI|nr:hypothetical protein [Tanacetum cinerariifolium]
MNPIVTQQTALDNALITDEVPAIYMHQFWNTIKKIGKIDAYDFKLDKKKYRFDTEELGYSRNCKMPSTIRTDHMHQPWRTFATVINKCISDFMYQDDNREISSARKEHMPYPRFTKVIINHFISKDNAISMRNKINLHTVRDDNLLGTLKFISKTEDYQKYGALIPDGMINQDIKDSTAYKTYLDYATGKVPPKKARKFKKPTSSKLKTVPGSPKEPTQKDAQLKKTLRKSKRETHKLQASGSSKRADFESEGDSKDEGDDFHEEDDNDDDDGNDDDSGNDDDGGNDAEDIEQTDSDDDENPLFTLKDYVE